MVDIIDIEYSALKKIDIDEETVSQLEKRYGVGLGRCVRQIWGKLGPIELLFKSKIGLNYPIRGREWEITYSTGAGPCEEGLVAIRPGAGRPLADEDYLHLYTAWCRDSWQGIALYVVHDGQLYAADNNVGPPCNRLYLKKLTSVTR